MFLETKENKNLGEEDDLFNPLRRLKYEGHEPRRREKYIALRCRWVWYVVVSSTATTETGKEQRHFSSEIHQRPMCD